MNLMNTAQRVSSVNYFDPTNYNRHLFAYLHASEIIKGNVIEVGCGDGYGIDILIDRCDHYVGVDKKKGPLSYCTIKCFDFFRMVLPYLKNIPSNMFDYVVSFQVIEHIKDDKTFINEIYRVLKPGGVLLLTTPNRLRSVSRNPWHVREYIASELVDLSSTVFSKIELKGIFGSDRVEEYLTTNSIKLSRIKRWDVFDLEHRLPRSLLRLPYDILNAFFKKKLRRQELDFKVDENDFFISDYRDNCLDLFLTATK